MRMVTILMISMLSTSTLTGHFMLQKHQPGIYQAIQAYNEALDAKDKATFDKNKPRRATSMLLN